MQGIFASGILFRWLQFVEGLYTGLFRWEEDSSGVKFQPQDLFSNLGTIFFILLIGTGLGLVVFICEMLRLPEMNRKNWRIICKNHWKSISGLMRLFGGTIFRNCWVWWKFQKLCTCRKVLAKRIRLNRIRLKSIINTYL